MAKILLEFVGKFSGESHILTEPLAVVSAGEVKMAVQVEVVRRQLGYPQDGLLTLVFDCPNVLLLLRLLHQRLLKTGDDLTLRVDVLDNK